MAQKRPLTFRVHPLLADRFVEATKPFYGKLGICAAAAFLMFLESDPQVQGAYAKKAFEMDVDEDVQAAIEAAKVEQLKRIKAREDHGGGARRRN